MKTKTTRYLVYRHGANSANQSMSNKEPVAIVTARSAGEACETEQDSHPTLGCAWMKLNPDVTVYANQHLTAVPVSRASRSDWNAVVESQQS